ncbi:hypothetical protein [Moraxella nasicaprae]|uniref:Galactokinase N-terminal domain-containing protein n=1 Tax=Moraxella nasicaprae TaxID=2904122 RepID=A0ABY6F4J4_9GAMM|nr:hypothetical protein [Moraxella nasicaprae]UXZ05005.1 hypothetical protein LU297_00690 [Moraxella nasicaprae]
MKNGLPLNKKKSAKYPKANGVAVIGEHSILDGGAYRIGNEGLTKFSKSPMRYKNKSTSQMPIAHYSKPFCHVRNLAAYLPKAFFLSRSCRVD